MGQEESALKGASNFDVTKFIKEGKARRIIVLTGAGELFPSPLDSQISLAGIVEAVPATSSQLYKVRLLRRGPLLKQGFDFEGPEQFRTVCVLNLSHITGISTSAGIPDFRSPDTGLYANLARLNLPFPEAVFDLNFFRQNPLPFYALAHELYPGKYRPTITHYFIRLLSDKDLLFKLFTQNIDCLEREAGVPGHKIVEAHGSFARQSCIECKAAYPGDLMKEAIQRKEVPYCTTPQCNGLVKPEIVFFGEQLPEEFLKNVSLLQTADLCIVMGTSLTVHPFASLPSLCSEGVPRMLINLEQVGGIGSRPNDALLLGDCDAGVRKLAAALGWLEELEALWKAANPEMKEVDQKEAPQSRDEELEAKVDKLTQELDTALKISNEHTNRVKNQLVDDEIVKDSGVDKPESQTAKSRDEDASKSESLGGLKHVFPHI